MSNMPQVIKVTNPMGRDDGQGDEAVPAAAVPLPASAQRPEQALSSAPRSNTLAW